MTSQLRKKKSKNFTIPWPKTAAYIYATKITNSKEYLLETSLIHVCGREKRVKLEHGVPKQVKSRITLCQEDIPLFISQSLSSLITNHLVKLDYSCSWSGKNIDKMNYDKLCNLININEKLTNFSTDFSGHDNSVSEQAIVVVFSLLRLYLPESEKLDKLSYYVMSSVIFKRIFLRGSFLVYDISKGLATGHSFTILITILVAYIIITTSI